MNGSISPQDAASMAKNVYDVNDTFFIKAFIKVTVHSTTYYRAPVLSSKVSPLTQLEVTYAHSNNPRQT